MKHSKDSCLDLQFLLPKFAKEARNIQKTVIFVNTISDIRPTITIIQGWMKQLGYPDSCMMWIWPYYSTMSDWDKDLTAAAFRIPGDENLECVILVAINAYGMGIDNPNVKLVIQQDLSLSFDSMIQQMGRAGRKGGLLHFILFTPAWIVVKDQEEIEKRSNTSSAFSSTANAQLQDSNWPKAIAQASPLSQTTFPDADTSDAESIAELEAADLDDVDLMATFLATKVDKDIIKKKRDQKTKQTDAAK